jgi:long-chain acyl-CoA synthetase
MIPELLRRRAEATPRGVACYSRGLGGWVATDWGTLWREVNGLAAELRRRGLRPGARVAIAGRTCRGWLVAELAVLLAGGVVVGIDPLAGARQSAFVMNHAGVAAVLTDRDSFLTALPADVRNRLLFTLPMNGPVSPADARPTDLPAGHADDPATIIYTAGTTGDSKGIEYSHAKVMAGTRSLVEAFPELEEGDATLCWLPMAHLYQRMMNLMALARGMVTYFVEDPREVGPALREVQPALFSAVPRFYEKLHDDVRAGAPPSEWRDRLAEAVGRRAKVFLTGSAPTSPRLLEFFSSLGLPVYEGYAMSENTVPMAANLRGACRFGSVGRPFPQNEIRFADDGEVLVRGPGVFRGYLGEQRPSDDRFTGDGFYRTGDLGRLDEDGFLYLTGRKAEIIKTSTGRRISPSRVEEVYKQSPYLDQVVVFGDGKTHLVALVALDATAVREALAREGTAVPADPDLAASASVKELVAREMARLGRALPPHEQVGAFAVLAAPLSAAEGELTPTQKLRRGVVASRHASLIERLYREGGQ